MEQLGKKTIQVIKKLGSKEKAQIHSRFFKTGPGEYGEGDVFVGVTVPVLRTVAKDLYKELQAVPFSKARVCIDILLTHKIHECRLVALYALVYLSEQAQKCIGKKGYDEKKTIQLLDMYAEYYMSKTRYVNNWDLVDTSARQILGSAIYLKGTSGLKTLQKLAKSPILWERRIACISAWYFTQKGDVHTHLAILQLVEGDTHDLMHKALGWMLREIGKVNKEVLLTYLDAKAHTLPRTALRYALERCPPREREKYMTMKR